MGKKTVKRLAILIGTLALIGGGGYFLWAFQVERMAQNVVARAQQAAAEGRYDEAERLYQEHLAVVPDDVAVQLEYAELILRPELSNRRDAALTIYQDVLRRYPGRMDVRQRAAELLRGDGRAHVRDSPASPGDVAEDA